MPGYVTEIKPREDRPAVARATLRVPGRYDSLSAEKKAAWNKATMAIHSLFELYDAEERP